MIDDDLICGPIWAITIMNIAGGTSMPMAVPAAMKDAHGEDEGEVGILTASDELFGAVEHITISPPLGGRAQGRGIRTALRLGQAERAKSLAVRHRPQILLLLLGRAVFENGHAADRVVTAHDGRDRPVAGGDLLNRQRIGDVVRVAGFVP